MTSVGARPDRDEAAERPAFQALVELSPLVRRVASAELLVERSAWAPARLATPLLVVPAEVLALER